MISRRLRHKNISFAALFFLVLIGGLAFSPTAATQAAPPPGTRVKTGIDVLEAEGFAPLRGKRVGVITNQTGVDAQGRRTIDLLAHAPGVDLVAIFSPEHGPAGAADASVENATDAATHLPVYSLYGSTRRPTGEMLRGLDALVFDVQDAGVRFYTYVTTMAYAMEAAAKADHHIAFFVLDRPDPLGGEVIEGPVLDANRTSFTAYFPMPVRYAMTLGELAQMFNAENKIGAALTVVRMENWQRSDTYAQTGLRFITPSPNLRNLNAAFFYPGVEILQAGGVSVGRGTDAPFEMLGAPWIHGADLVANLSQRQIPGVAFAPAAFTPDADPFKGQPCDGVTLTLSPAATAGRAAFQSMRLGLELADALHRLYPGQFQLDKIIFLLGSQRTIDQLKQGTPPGDIIASWAPDLAGFSQIRAQYLLYK